MPLAPKKMVMGKESEADEITTMVTKLSSLHSWIKAQTLIRPKQLGRSHGEGGGGLSDEDDDEYVTISLTSRDPGAPGGRVRWNHTQARHEELKYVETMICHLDIESTIVNAFSAEGREQVVEFGLEAPEDEEEEDREGREAILEKYKPWIKKRQEELEANPEPKKFRNQFSFIERATQTKSNSLTTSGSQTDPPPVDVLAGTVSASLVHDFYVASEKAGEEREKKENALKALEGGEVEEDVGVKKETDEGVAEIRTDTLEKRMLLSAKMLERMVNLDTFDDVAKDYRFYEDPADDHRDHADGVCPLFLALSSISSSRSYCPSGSSCFSDTWRRPLGLKSQRSSGTQDIQVYSSLSNDCYC